MKSKVLLVFLPILFISVLNAQNISLEQSISLARKNNKSIQSQDNLIQSARWQKKNALSRFLPKANFNENWLRLDKESVIIPAIPLLGINEPVTQPKNNFTSEISISQPLFASGKLYLNYRMSNQNLQQCVIQNKLKTKELDWETAKLYFQILKLKDIRDITQKTTESYSAHYEKAQIKHKNGSGLLTEVLQWKVKYETALSDLSSLDNNLKILMDTWLHHLGQKENQKALIPEKINLTDLADKALKYSEMNEEQKTAEQERFINDFKSKNLNKQSIIITKQLLDSGLKLTQSDFLPVLSLNFTYQFENDDKLNFKDSENWKLMALFSMPLFQGGTNYSAYKSQYYKTKQQTEELENVEELLEIGAKKAFLELYDLAGKTKSNTVNLELATENMKQVNHLFDQGMLTYNDMMDAELMYQSVNISYYSDLYDFLIKEYEVKLYRED